MHNYLFSYHFGLLIHFFPVGHIAYKVMALRPHERYLLTRVLQALLCAAPQNQLVGDRDCRSRVKKMWNTAYTIQGRFKKLTVGL